MAGIPLRNFFKIAVFITIGAAVGAAIGIILKTGLQTIPFFLQPFWEGVLSWLVTVFTTVGVLVGSYLSNVLRVRR